MAQYIQVGGVARRVTKAYTNVKGTARRVTKAYTAVAGTARKYFPGELVLYDAGSECAGVTGGWVFGQIYNTGGVANGHDYHYGIGGETDFARSKNPGDLEIRFHFNGTTMMNSVFTDSPVDVTRYTTLHVLVTEELAVTRNTQPDGSCGLYYAVKSERPSPGVRHTEHRAAFKMTTVAEGESVSRTREVAVDVSGLSGAVYPCFYTLAYQCVATASVKIHKVWLT